MNDREMEQFEKATQDYYKEFWEYIWAWVGTLASFSVVAGGIYFSQLAFSSFLGNSDAMVVLSCGIALMISGLEVAGITLLGNKTRSVNIRNSNNLEHKIMTYFTWGLFSFDILSNFYGLYITVFDFVGKVNLLAWVFIVLLSALMGGGEIIVGWMIRGLAVHRAQFHAAKTLYDKFNRKIESETLETSGGNPVQSTYNPNLPNNRR